MSGTKSGSAPLCDNDESDEIGVFTWLQIYRNIQTKINNRLINNNISPPLTTEDHVPPEELFLVGGVPGTSPVAL